MKITQNMSTVLQALNLPPQARDVRFQDTRLVSEVNQHQHAQASNGYAHGYARRGNWQTIPQSRKRLFEHFKQHISTNAKWHISRNAKDGKPRGIPNKVIKRYNALVRDVKKLGSKQEQDKPIAARQLRKLAVKLVDVTAQLQSYHPGTGTDTSTQASNATLRGASVLYDTMAYDSKGQLTRVHKPLWRRALKHLALRFQRGRNAYARQAAAGFAKALIDKHGEGVAFEAFDKRGLALDNYLAGLANPSVRPLSVNDVAEIERNIARPYADAKNIDATVKQLARDYALDGSHRETLLSQLDEAEREALENPNRTQLFSSRFRTLVEGSIIKKGYAIGTQEVEKIALETWQALAAVTDDDAQRLVDNDEKRNNALWNHFNFVEAGRIKEGLQSLAEFNNLVDELMDTDPVVGKKNGKSFDADEKAMVIDMARRPLVDMGQQRAEKATQQLYDKWARGWGIAIGVLRSDAGEAYDKNGQTFSVFFPYKPDSNSHAAPATPAVMSDADLRALQTYVDYKPPTQEALHQNEQDAHWEAATSRVIRHELSFYRLNRDLQIAGSERAQSEGEEMDILFRNAIDTGDRLRRSMNDSSRDPQDLIVAMTKEAMKDSGLPETQQRAMFEAIADYARNNREKTS